MRHPAGLDYPQPTDLHTKLTSETYIGSLQRTLNHAAIPPTARGVPRPSRVRRGDASPVVEPRSVRRHRPAMAAAQGVNFAGDLGPSVTNIAMRSSMSSSPVSNS